MQDPMMLADWPNRNAYDLYKRAIREALAQPDLRARNRMLSQATAAWDCHLEEESRMAA